MILVTGGLGSGRHEFVRRCFPGRECLEFGPAQAQEALAAGAAPSEAALQLFKRHPDAVIITQEVGCGVVPIDASDRAWREALGRAACVLAAESDTVILMTAGIGTAIKGRMPE